MDDIKKLVEELHRAEHMYQSAPFGVTGAPKPVSLLGQAASSLESLLSGQPVDVPGCVVKMQLVPVSLHVDMIEAWSKLALGRIKNPDANKGFEASMHETYRAILAASAAMLTASASESGEGV